MRATHRIIYLCFTIACVAAGPVHAQVISIEAEDYTDSLDTGGVTIDRVINSGCSGGYIVTGIDIPGEWTAYDLAVDTLGVYAPRLWIRGTYDVEYHFQLTLAPDTLGSPQTIDYYFTGHGYG